MRVGQDTHRTLHGEAIEIITCALIGRRDSQRPPEATKLVGIGHHMKASSIYISSMAHSK